MGQPIGPLAPGSARVAVTRVQRQRTSLTRVQLLVAGLTIAVASLVMYLQPVFDLGFYYDDWSLQASFSDAAGSSFSDLFSACRQVDPAGRPGGCLYHAATYLLLGDTPEAYHLLSIVLLVTSTSLIYLLLRQCRLGHWPALLVCVLYIVYPGSDATRLWPTSIGAQYILSAYVGGVLLGIEGLRRRDGQAAACHAASVALFLLMVFTYEVVLPLIAISGAFYLLAVANRRAALQRWAFDALLAGVFIVYRLVLAPVDPASDFTTQRTFAETLDRVRAVTRGAWNSWYTLFLPGPAPVIAGLLALAVVVAAIQGGRVRREILVWLAVAAGAAGFAVLAVLPYVPAHPLYVPDTGSLFDRLNIASAPAYCVAFVALAGATRAALGRWMGVRVATVALGVAVALIAVRQVAVERHSQDAWATSWDAQQTAIKGLERAAPKLPPNATLMSFGHPIWERGFIPVFAAGWDLRGAMDVETRVDPPQAVPFVDTATCGAQASEVSGVAFARYDDANSPLWFVNTRTSEVRRIASRAACDAAVKAWGRPPFWGVSITGPV